MKKFIVILSIINLLACSYIGHPYIHISSEFVTIPLDAEDTLPKSEVISNSLSPYSRKVVSQYLEKLDTSRFRLGVNWKDPTNGKKYLIKQVAWRRSLSSPNNAWSESASDTDPFFKTRDDIEKCENYSLVWIFTYNSDEFANPTIYRRVCNGTVTWKLATPSDYWVVYKFRPKVS